MGMTKFQRRYVAIETVISMVINCAISWGMFMLLFGGRPQVPLRGLDGALIDFIPQTFMIALMSLLVPTFLTRRRVTRGRIGSIADSPLPLPANMFIRALLVAALATFFLGGIAAALLLATTEGTISFGALLIVKCVYGALVALIVTPIAVTAALTDRTPGPSKEAR